MRCRAFIASLYVFGIVAVLPVDLRAEHATDGGSQNSGADSQVGQAALAVENRDPFGTSRRLATLNRLVKHFDFEEAEHAPITMPRHFYRYGADGIGAAHGFPPFGRMRLTNEVAYSGNWSLQFELDGGSLAARVPTAVIPVMPHADYLVTTRVRTEGLKHARARLVAWLHDDEGQMIRDSRVASRPIATDGEWDVLAVTLRGEWARAADLVLELQLVQPRQYRYDAADANEPMPEDVTGRAWFDDVSVWHLPHIDLAVDAPANVVVAPQQPTIIAVVRDYTMDGLIARLRVFDLDGRVVFHNRYPEQMLQRDLRIDLQLPAFGWYRAVLDVESGGQVTARQWTDLAYVPELHRRHAQQQNPLAIALPETWIRDAELLPTLFRSTGAGTLILPIWTRHMQLDEAGENQEILRRTIESLRALNAELVLSFESVPEELARKLDTDAEDVLSVMNRLGPQWQSAINELFVSFGVEVSRWQFGGTGSASALWRSDADELVRLAHKAVAAFAPKPNVLVALRAEQATDEARALPGRNVWIPYSLRPDAILEAVSQWTEDEKPLIVSLGRTPSGRLMHDSESAWRRAPEAMYSERLQTVDLVLRVLHVWRAGARTIALRPMWTTTTEQREHHEPDIALPVVRELAGQLSGRRPVSELSLAGGMRCWVLAGNGPDDGALIVWHESAKQQQPKTLSFLLADGPVTVRDVFGNVREVPRRTGRHTIELTELPQFVEGISLELVQFRGGFALEPAFIQAERRLHGHELVLHNPWSMPISGTIRLHESDDWRISPRVHDFVIRPGDRVRLPVEIVLEHGMVAGVQPLRADVELVAETNYRFVLETDVEIGLDHLDLHATWRIAHNSQTGEDDLIVTQYVTNTGDRRVSLDSYLLGANVRQQRRVVGGLEPGEMAIRHFRIPGGASLLAGTQLRVGISERNGLARLSKLLDVSELAAHQASAPAEQPEQD